MMAKDRVLAKLREVIDPELGVNIVDLGFIYKVEVRREEGRGKRVYIKMTLTSPMCPLGESLTEEVEKKVREIKGVKSCLVDLTFDPPWTPEKISPPARQKLGI